MVLCSCSWLQMDIPGSDFVGTYPLPKYVSQLCFHFQWYPIKLLALFIILISPVIATGL